MLWIYGNVDMQNLQYEYKKNRQKYPKNLNINYLNSNHRQPVI